MDYLSYNKEKVKTIIDNLQSQFSQNVSGEKLIESVHLLLSELRQGSNIHNTKKNIAVVMPAAFVQPPANTGNTGFLHQEAEEEKNEDIVPVIPPGVDNEEPDHTEQEVTIPMKETEQKENDESIFNAWNIFGTTSEAPTITSYESKEGSKELNESFSGEPNDLAQSLQNIPIHDLTTAIGINDRYLFINELFRGDEFMYERSIITLNKFNSYDQAHGWIERELKLKLGWDLENTTTRQFEQLIKRRFLKL